MTLIAGDKYKDLETEEIWVVQQRLPLSFVPVLFKESDPTQKRQIFPLEKINNYQKIDA